MNDDFSAVMATLREPAPPSAFKPAVMARIARETDRQAAPAPGASGLVRRREHRGEWVWIVAGLALVLGASVYQWLATGLLPDLTSPRIGRNLALIPMEGPGALLAGLGLLVYLAGLLAPLRSGGQSVRRPATSGPARPD